MPGNQQGNQQQQAMHPALAALFERHVAGSFDKQLFLAELIGDGAWQFDLPRGLLQFGDRPAWRAQVLGTVSQRTGNWRWGWADDPGVVPPDLVKVATAFHRLGEARQVPELLNAELPRGEWIGTRLALTASGVFNARAFYRAPYEGGAAFLLVAGPTFPPNDVFPPARILSVFPQAVARFPVNARRALAGYAHYYGLAADPDEADVVVRQGGKAVLRATFDAQDRLTGLRGG